MPKIKNNPIVSVIIPTYNRADLLPRAVRSVLNQTFQDFELIIVDDGSTDNTQEIVKEFQQKDNRIQYIWQKNSGAPPKPKNTGIKHSQGKYLAFLDSDDEWLPEKLEKQIDLFKRSNNPKLGFVGCNVLMINKSNNIKMEYKIPRYKDPLKESLVRCYIWSCSSAMVKKEVMEDIGLFDENLRLTDDKEIWIRILQKYDFDFVDETLFKYCMHEGNTMRTVNFLGYTMDHEHIVKKHQEIYQRYPKLYSDQLRHLGSKFYRLGKIQKGNKYIKKSLECNPLNLKSYLYYLLSFFGTGLYNKIYDLTISRRSNEFQRFMDKAFPLMDKAPQKK